MLKGEWPDLYSSEDEAFIRKAYLSILGRAVDEAGLAHYGNRLKNGCGRLSVLYDLFHSREAGGRVKGDVPPDEEGLIKQLITEEKFNRSLLGILLSPWRLHRSVNALASSVLQGCGVGVRAEAAVWANGARANMLQDDVIRYAVWVTGGIGDALIIARFIRDFQAYAGDGLEFDVYFHSPDVANLFYKEIPGFRSAVHSAVFQDVVSAYDFALHTNQFVTFSNEHIKKTKLAYYRPLVLSVYSIIESKRAGIEKYIRNHPNFDGAFADLATKQGYKRYKYLHVMSGLEYGGDDLKISGMKPDLVHEYGLVDGGYITIHDGWDAKYDFQKHVDRPTKSLPIKIWKGVVALLKIRNPNIKIVQIGGKTGSDIPGVDLNLKNKLTLAESISILSGALLHVDTDSGLVHIASALGVRSVVTFGPTNHAWFGYDKNINIPPAECGNCWWSTGTWMEECPADYQEPVCMASHEAHRIAHYVIGAISDTKTQLPGAGIGFVRSWPAS